VAEIEPTLVSLVQRSAQDDIVCRADTSTALLDLTL
jgi:hypothetical protein